MRKIRLVLLVCLGIGLGAYESVTLTLAGVITPLPPAVQVTDAGLPSLADARDPDLAVSGNTLYAAWLDERNSIYSPDIYFSKSTDLGQSWSANALVSFYPTDETVDPPVITVQPNGTIWIAWQLSYRNGNPVSQIRLARSTDGGQTFTRYTVVDEPDSDLRRPAIASDAGRVYVLYHVFGQAGGDAGYDIRLKVVDSQTLNVTTVNVSDSPRAGRVTAGLFDDGPAMSLRQNNGLLCAAWEDRRSTFAIYSACSTNNGASFSANQPVSGANAVKPVIALAPNGTLYATYADNSDLRSNIILRVSTDRGAIWGAPIPATNVDIGFTVSRWDLAVDANGQLLLSWLSNGNAVLSTSIDGGQNISGLKVIGDQNAPVTLKLVASGSGVNTRAHLIWQDIRGANTRIWSGSALLDGIAPTAPANLQAQGEDNSIVLTWSPSSDASGIRGYHVYRAASAGGPFSSLTPVLVSGTFYRDVEVLGGASFTYKVAAVDGTGNVGPFSNIASAAAQAGTGLPVNGAIAYESGNNIRLRTLAGGVESTIASVSDPHYSTDGQRLYFSDGQSIAWRPSGGGPTTPFAGPFLDSLFGFDIAADQTAFAAIDARTFAAPGVPGGFCFVSEPHYFERVGVERYEGTFRLASESEIALSADRRWLAYRDEGVCTPSVYARLLPPNFCLINTAAGSGPCVPGADYRDPDFAPSGNWLVFAAPLSGQYEIWKALVLDDGTLASYTQLTRGPANQPSRYPAFSTDGNWVIFARDVDPGNGENFQLFVVRNDGYGLRALSVAGRNPDWLGGGSAPPPPALPYTVALPLVVKSP